MTTRGRKLVATDESTVIAKPLLDPTVVKNGEGDSGLSNPASSNESNRGEILSELDYLFDQLVTSKEGPRWWGWEFPRFSKL